MWQEFCNPDRAVMGIDQQSFARVFGEQLSTPATRHEYLAITIDRGESDQPTSAGCVQRRNESALGTQCQAVRRVLNIATRYDPTVIDDCRCTHRERRV